MKYTLFKDDKAGCTEAKHYLISIGKWSNDIERRDGWEIVSIANKEIQKHNDLQDFDTLSNGEWGSLIDDSKDWKPYDDI